MATMLNFAGRIGYEEGRSFIILSDQSGNEYKWFPSQEVLDGIAGFMTPSGYVNSSEVRKVTRQAVTHFTKAQAYAREGDWAKFGAQLKKLGTTLERIARISVEES